MGCAGPMECRANSGLLAGSTGGITTGTIVLRGVGGVLAVPQRGQLLAIPGAHLPSAATNTDATQCTGDIDLCSTRGVTGEAGALDRRTTVGTGTCPGTGGVGNGPGEDGAGSAMIGARPNMGSPAWGKCTIAGRPAGSCSGSPPGCCWWRICTGGAVIYSAPGPQGG